MGQKIVSTESDLLSSLTTKRSEILNVIGEIKLELSHMEDGDLWAIPLIEMRDDFIVQLGLIAEAIKKLEEAIEFSNQKLSDVQRLLDDAYKRDETKDSMKARDTMTPEVPIHNKAAATHTSLKKEYKKKAY